MATVIQRSHSNFEMGKKAPTGAMVTTKIKCLVKQEASKDVFKPASEVVNDILLNELTDAPCPSLPCRQSTTNCESLPRAVAASRPQRHGV